MLGIYTIPEALLKVVLPVLSWLFIVGIVGYLLERRSKKMKNYSVWLENKRKERIQRSKQIALLITMNGCSIRQTARVIGVSKTTVHRDIHEVLEDASKVLYNRVMDVLDNRNNNLKHELKLAQGSH